MANFHVLNDLSIICWICARNPTFPPSNPDWAPTPKYYAFELFSRHFGDQLIRSVETGPTFDTQTVGMEEALKGLPYLDVVSSLSSDGQHLYIIATNRQFDSPIEATIALRDFKPLPGGTAWTLAGTGIDATNGNAPINVPGRPWGKQIEDPQNPRFSKGGPGEITYSSSPVTGVNSQFTYRFPAHSVTSLVLSRFGK